MVCFLYPDPRLPAINHFHIGGLMCLSDIANILRKRNVRWPPDTKCALILDSTPAPTTFTSAFRATMTAMPGGLRKLIVGALIYIIYFLTFVARALFRRPTLTTREMAAINDPTPLPWASATTATPRMYLYSTADIVISSNAIEAHAAEARRAGFPVQIVNFKTSAHVSHARDYPEKYWGAVAEFWKDAMRLHGGNDQGRADVPVPGGLEVRVVTAFRGWTKELRWSLYLSAAAPSVATSEALTLTRCLDTAMALFYGSDECDVLSVR